MNKEYLKDLTTKRIPEHYIDAAISACAAAALDLDARLRAIEQAKAPADRTDVTLLCEGCGATFSEAGRPYRAMVGCRCSTPLVPIKQPTPDDATAIEAGRKAYDEFRNQGIPGTKGVDAAHKYALAYHDERSKRDAATIAELREQLQKTQRDMAFNESSLGRAEKKFQEQEATIAELREQLQLQHEHTQELERAGEIDDQTIAELQRQLSARPARMPELTAQEVEDAVASISGFPVLPLEYPVRMANVCIDRAREKGREPFNLDAWWNKNYNHLVKGGTTHEACLSVLAAAGIPVKE